MPEPEGRKEILSARKDDEVSLRPARHRSEVDKIPTLPETQNIHAGRIGALVVGVFIDKPRVQQKSEQLFHCLFVRLFFSLHGFRLSPVPCLATDFLFRGHFRPAFFRSGLRPFIRRGGAAARRCNARLSVFSVFQSFPSFCLSRLFTPSELNRGGMQTDGPTPSALAQVKFPPCLFALRPFRNGRESAPGAFIRARARL